MESTAFQKESKYQRKKNHGFRSSCPPMVQKASGLAQTTSHSTGRLQKNEAYLRKEAAKAKKPDSHNYLRLKFQKSKIRIANNPTAVNTKNPSGP